MWFRNPKVVFHVSIFTLCEHINFTQIYWSNTKDHLWIQLKFHIFHISHVLSLLQDGTFVFSVAIQISCSYLFWSCFAWSPIQRVLYQTPQTWGLTPETWTLISDTWGLILDLGPDSVFPEAWCLLIWGTMLFVWRLRCEVVLKCALYL